MEAHELITLRAPRPTFMAAVAAGPAFRLLGKNALGTTEFPEVAARGGHTNGPNWPTFLRFADRYLKVAPDPAAIER